MRRKNRTDIWKVRAVSRKHKGKYWHSGMETSRIGLGDKPSKFRYANWRKAIKVGDGGLYMVNRFSQNPNVKSVVVWFYKGRFVFFGYEDVVGWDDVAEMMGEKRKKYIQEVFGRNRKEGRKEWKPF